MCVFAQSAAENWGTFRRVGMIDGESRDYGGVISLAHGLHFFICQRLLVSYSPRAGQYHTNQTRRTDYEIPTWHTDHKTTSSGPIFVEAEKRFEQMKEFSQ